MTMSKDGKTVTLPMFRQERLLLLARAIRPVRSYEKNGQIEIHYLVRCGLHEPFYTVKRTPANISEGLERIGSITTLHVPGPGMVFRPTIAEVLSQIPTEYIVMETAAFETLQDAREPLTKDGRYHRAITTLYRKAPK